MTVLTLASSEGLRDVRIQSHEQAAAEESQHDKNVGAQADRAHGGRAVGEAPYHHRIDDGHAHPAELGEDERNSQTQRGAEFTATGLASAHGWRSKTKSLSGAGERSKREQLDGSSEAWQPPRGLRISLSRSETVVADVRLALSVASTSLQSERPSLSAGFHSSRIVRRHPTCPVA